MSKELPVVTAIGVGPGPKTPGRETYSLLLYKIQGDKVLSCELLTTCYFGIGEVMDEINNRAFDIFLLTNLARTWNDQ